MNSGIRKHFESGVANYNTVADKVVFDNDGFHRHLVDAIPFNPERVLEVLDIGSGTGHTSRVILEKFPHAYVTGIDFSHNMICRSLEQLAKYDGRYRVLEQDCNIAEFDRKYDVVISAFTIHNSSTNNQKKLTEKIFDALNQRGIFVNADFLKGENSAIEQEYRKIYETHLRQNLNGHELSVWLHHAFKQDNPRKYSEQKRDLDEAGFKKVELIWQLNNQGIYVARK